MSTVETILITGSAGFLGSLLGQKLAEKASHSPRLLLTDVVEPTAPPGSHAKAFKVDLTDSGQIRQLFETTFGVPDTIYCMHGIMSRGAEDHFDLGLKINIDSVVSLLQAARDYGARVNKLIRFIFTSSLAVYGGPLPKIVTPSTIAIPQSAYGMEKLTSELYVNEFTRRGFIDGRICRLPTIVVRPGPPAAATSSFLSAIIREPLNGQRATCPIGDSRDSPELDLPVWLASPTTTIQNLILARMILANKFSPHTRVVCLPGFTVTIRGMLQALERIAGPQRVGMIDFKDDETNRRIVSSWPATFDCQYAMGLGFKHDSEGMDRVILDFMEITKSSGRQ